MVQNDVNLFLLSFIFVALFRTEMTPGVFLNQSELCCFVAGLGGAGVLIEVAHLYTGPTSINYNAQIINFNKIATNKMGAGGVNLEGELNKASSDLNNTQIGHNIM